MQEAALRGSSSQVNMECCQQIIALMTWAYPVTMQQKGGHHLRVPPPATPSPIFLLSLKMADRPCRRHARRAWLLLKAQPCHGQLMNLICDSRRERHKLRIQYRQGVKMLVAHKQSLQGTQKLVCNG